MSYQYLFTMGHSLLHRWHLDLIQMLVLMLGEETVAAPSLLFIHILIRCWSFRVQLRAFLGLLIVLALCFGTEGARREGVSASL